MNPEEKELAGILSGVRDSDGMRKILGTPDQILDRTPIEQTDLIDIYKSGVWSHEYIYRNKWKTINLHIKESETGQLHFFVSKKDVEK